MSWACFAVGTFAVVKVCIINLYHKYTHTSILFFYIFLLNYSNPSVYAVVVAAQKPRKSKFALYKS